MTETVPAFRMRHLRDVLAEGAPTARAAILVLPIPAELEAGHFPRLCWEPVYVQVQSGASSMSVSGVMESGVFWYKVERGPGASPLGDGLFWATVDRLESVAAYVARHLTDA